MVADLLEAHEKGEYQPLAANALGFLKLLGQLFDGLLVERGLLAAELAEGLDLGLVGQIRDDGLVGLEAPQDVRPYQVAQRAVGVVRFVREALGVARELPGRAEQPRVEEVEDRPQVAEPVFDRGAGEHNPRLCRELLCRSRLLGVRVLDRLGLVEDREVPRGGREPGDAQERAVARDHEVNVRERLWRERLQLVGRHGRRMRDHGLEPGREPFDLRGPVGEQRRRGHQQARPPLAILHAPQHEQQREHLDGLAEAHVIGEAGAEAEPGKQVEPADTDLLVGPKGAVQLTTGIDLLELLGRAQPLEGLGEPWSRDDTRPFGIGAIRNCRPS